jgi:hypothetical protein
MADLWRAEISWDGIIATPPPDPALTAGDLISSPQKFMATSLAFMVGDGAANFWVATAGLGADISGGAAEFQAQFNLVQKANKPPFFLDDPDPFIWGAFWTSTGLNQPAGSAGAAYFAGGQLVVEKDFLNNKITLITPIGNIVRTLNEHDVGTINSGLNDTPLFPKGMGLQYSIPQDGVHSPVNIDTRAQFFNMYQLRNGIIRAGNTLHSDDPGIWQPTIYDINTVAAPFGPFYLTETQAPSRYVLEGIISAGSYPASMEFDIYRFAGAQPPVDNGTDMETGLGVLWKGGPSENDGSTMRVARSFDNAHTWDAVTAFSDITTSNNSPTLTWYNDRLYLTWHDGSFIRQSRSQDGGHTWEMPTTIPFVGTNPRRVIDRTGGGSYYFYFNGAGDLLVVITFDSGATYEGPFTVAAAVGAQQIDAEFAPDGSIVVSLFVAAVWTQYRSRTLGHTWS